jgi:mannose-6-phosphate isomerase
MTAERLSPRAVERIWGRTSLPPAFRHHAGRGEPIGEIWFEDGAATRSNLLVKYLFTSQRLSVQVHPDDEAARRQGWPCGKDEAWYILEAEPDAVIGLGLRRKVTRDELKAAARDGSIEELIDWRPVKAGDSFFSPAGTIHAIGGGLSLIEVQQNVDATLRLYDYGRPRELHLDRAAEVARCEPFAASPVEDSGDGRKVLARSPHFILEHWRIEGGALLDGPGESLIVPLTGRVALSGTTLPPGSVWRAGDARELEMAGECLVARANRSEDRK